MFYNNDSKQYSTPEVSHSCYRSKSVSQSVNEFISSKVNT